MLIHPTAIVAPGAKLHPTVQVAAYAVIDAMVVLEEGCVVGPHVHLTGDLHVGPHCQFHAGSVIGDAPQDAKYDGSPTRCRLGAHNIIREHVTIHRSNSLDEDTVLGEGNFLMAHCHVGHNCRLGNRNILANGALLGGHVLVEDGAFISGHCLVHQFVRIGSLAMMQGGAGISKDLPPFMTASGINTVCGLNTIGLRRAGMGPEDRTELRRLYHHLFSSGLTISEASLQGQELFSSTACQQVLAFIGQATRGICRDSRQRSGAARAEL